MEMQVVPKAHHPGTAQTTGRLRLAQAGSGCLDDRFRQRRPEQSAEIRIDDVDCG
jgi:hypothetical protein